MAEKTKTAFTESDTRRTRRTNKRKLIITDQGVDWSGYSEEDRIEILSNLAGDEQVTATLKEISSAVTATNIIEAKHINFFLDIIEGVEQFLIPKLVERKMKAAGSPFVIEPLTAQEAFVFTDEQKKKIIPAGIKAANEQLPEKVKKLISKVGPGSEFLIYTFQALREQQITAITLQLSRDQEKNAARNQHNSAPTRTRPNGKATAVPVEPSEVSEPLRPIASNVGEQIA